MVAHGPDAWFPAPRQIASGPVLAAVDGFIDAEAAGALLALFGDEAWVVEHADHYGWSAEGFSAEVPVSCSPLLRTLVDRIDALTGARSAARRTVRFRYYNEGEGHPPHTDTYRDEDGLILGATALLALMDTPAGGETCFPCCAPEPVAVAPRLGRLLWWNSTGPEGVDDPRSRHEGRVVQAGSKAVLLSFTYLPAERHPALPPLEPLCPTAS